jgi:hypothetical protein
MCGIGMIKLVEKRNDEAAPLFKKALSRDPNCADALYGMAFLAERHDKPADALILYTRAFTANTKHVAAREAADRIRATLTGAPLADLVPTTQPRPIPEKVLDITGTSFYEFLEMSGTPEGRQAVRLMQKLEIQNRTPRASAHLGSLLCAVIFLGAFLVYVNHFDLFSRANSSSLDVVQTVSSTPSARSSGPSRSDTHDYTGPSPTMSGQRGAITGLRSKLLESAFLLLPLMALSLAGTVIFLQSRFTKYTISGGWIKVKKGIIFVDEKMWEVLHLNSAVIESGPINRLTRNGCLVIEFDHSRRLELKGLASIDDLNIIRDDLIFRAWILRGYRGILTP